MTRTKQPPRFPGFGDRHVCGFYYMLPSGRQYLPQIKLDSHTTINPVYFNTTLKQLFTNPTNETITQARYTFPLYDGVAVSSYTISYSGKFLKGVVKQKDVAKQEFQAAVDRGETAGLLESLPAGIFGTSIGNLPANTDIHVEIQYCGALTHDAELDGLRFTLPTSIAPRYGDYPGHVLQSNTSAQGGMKVIVDVDVGSSTVRKVQSPSHPIALSMGALSHDSMSTAFEPSKASATLTLGTTELGADFVLQVVVDDSSKPQAVIEQHSSLPDRAIISTLVPHFNLQQQAPEIVFIVDQSGSMRGPKNAALKSALVVFLKSLPFGVRFNLCAFGGSFQYLWKKSQAYNEDNLNSALAFVETFQAQYGGTQMLAPITAAFDQRLGDLPLEVMLLSDGEIWDEDHLFCYINSKIHAREDVDARVFALGIGSDVSSTLIEGVARAGNGFAQFITANEQTDQKIVRMLKGALFPHTRDYSIEVHYDKSDDEHDVQMDSEEDSEFVKRANESRTLHDQPATQHSTQAPISFFDPSIDTDAPIKTATTDRYAHLPAITPPSVLQAPSSIPTLFPFNRTSIYLLLSEASPPYPVSSVTLRATSPQGLLELNIPITARQNGTTVHTLAARKAIQDLEEGRGWLRAAKTSDGRTAKETYASRYDEMVESEAVRLGERYQVAGKWCSFVAVQERQGDTLENMSEDQQPAAEMPTRAPAIPRMQMASTPQSGLGGPGTTRIGMAREKRASPSSFSAFGAVPPPPPAPGSGALFGAPPSALAPQTSSGSGISAHGPGLGARGCLSSLSATVPPPPPQAQANLARDQKSSGKKRSAARPSSSGNSTHVHIDTTDNTALQDHQTQLMLLDQSRSSSPELEIEKEQYFQAIMRPASSIDRATLADLYSKAISADELTIPDEDIYTDDVTRPHDVLHSLIALQSFDGSWRWSEEVFKLLGARPTFDEDFGDKDVMATALVIAFLETKIGDKKEVWEMVVMKARNWIEFKIALQGGEGEGRAEAADRLVESAKKLL